MARDPRFIGATSWKTDSFYVYSYPQTKPPKDGRYLAFIKRAGGDWVFRMFINGQWMTEAYDVEITDWADVPRRPENINTSVHYNNL